MTQTYRELVIGGVLVAPIVSYAVATIFILGVLRPALRIIEFSRLFSNPAIAELGLYITIFGVLTLWF
jgi:Protein of unknown function (DUF1656)